MVQRGKSAHKEVELRPPQTCTVHMAGSTLSRMDVLESIVLCSLVNKELPDGWDHPDDTYMSKHDHI